jgi:hypothetical protein
MIAREFTAAIRLLGLSQSNAYELLSLSEANFRGYGNGSVPIPGAVALLLRVAIGMGGVGRIEAAERKGRVVLTQETWRVRDDDRR